jgi:hypothetical protein
VCKFSRRQDKQNVWPQSVVAIFLLGAPSGPTTTLIDSKQTAHVLLHPSSQVEVPTPISAVSTAAEVLFLLLLLLEMQQGLACSYPRQPITLKRLVVDPTLKYLSQELGDNDGVDNILV